MIVRFEKFTVLNAKITRNIRKIKNQEMAEYGLRSVHISCLYYIYTIGPLTATELCEHCEEDKATISRALDFLEKQDYLFCESRTIKRYKCPFSLTEKGIEVSRKIANKIDYVFGELNSCLTEKERFEFYRSLTAINDCLERCLSGINVE